MLGKARKKTGSARQNTWRVCKNRAVSSLFWGLDRLKKNTVFPREKIRLEPINLEFFYSVY